MWNHRNPSYKNKLKKQIFWTTLVDELNTSFKANVPFEYSEVIRKWNNLKSYFVAENQKLFRAQKSGAGVEELEAISAAWKFQKKLNFLSSIVVPTPSLNNFNKRSLKFLQSSSSSAIETDFSDSPPATTPTPPTFQKSSPLPESLDTNQFQETELTTSPVALSPPLPPAATFTPQRQQGTYAPNHPKKQTKVMKENQTLAASLIEKSNELTEALTRKMNCASGASSDNTAFANCIALEISKLDEDLNLQGKQQVFNIIFQLQAEQLRRKSNGLPADNVN